MVPVALWNTLRYRETADAEQFFFLNSLSHTAVWASLTARTGVPGIGSPMLSFSQPDQLAHWQEHVAIAQAQGTTVPSLQEMSFDPNSEDEFYDFLSNHTVYTQIQQAAEGIST